MTTFVDFDRLQSFTDGDRALQAELSALFVATARGYLDGLRAALDDAAAWRSAAHGLKGAASNLGAVAMAELAAAAETTPPDATRLQALQAALATTKWQLEADLDRPGAAAASEPAPAPGMPDAMVSGEPDGRLVQLGRE